jgi:hypothetical protein
MIFHKSTIAATAMALLLAACAQVGNRFNQDGVSQLRPGISTEQEAIALLGQPVSWVAMPDGGKAVKWMYAYGTALATGGGAAVIIAFAPDGRMRGIVGSSNVSLSPFGNDRDESDFSVNDKGHSTSAAFAASSIFPATRPI